jgi:hypothetical protein
MAWWFTPVIPALGGWLRSPVLEHLLSKHETLSLNSSAPKTKQNTESLSLAYSPQISNHTENIMYMKIFLSW